MKYQLIVNLFELLAAITGTVIIRKYRTSRIVHYFVYFLWLTVLVELTMGWIPTIIRYSDELYHFKNTLLGYNYWAYNIYYIISYSFYAYFFREHLRSFIRQKILIQSIYIYIIGSIISCVISYDNFLTQSIPFITIAGSIILTMSVLFYLYEMLNSDKILNFDKNFVFYIGVSALIFHVIVAPLFIYSIHFTTENPDFIKFRGIVLYGANILLYSVYTYSFIQCLRKNNSY